MMQTEALRSAMHSLFRRFGALSSDSTPCGKPIPIAHAHALMLLGAEGELSQQALGAALGIDKSNVARLCAKMVALGHVEQRSCDNDARSRVVSLTKAGRALGRDVERGSRSRFGALLRRVPAGRRGAVVEALRDLTSALEAPPRVVAPRNGGRAKVSA